jgi:hypothetical protein
MQQERDERHENDIHCRIPNNNSIKCANTTLPSSKWPFIFRNRSQQFNERDLCNRPQQFNRRNANDRSYTHNKKPINDKSYQVPSTFYSFFSCRGQKIPTSSRVMSHKEEHRVTDSESRIRRLTPQLSIDQHIE